jgi:hypothetical protein
MMQHFGLEVFFMTTRKSKTSMWPRDKNFRWHDAGACQTTLCYLTLPKEMAPTVSCSTNNRDVNTGCYSLDASLAIQVTMPRIKDREARKRQFHRALSVLDLRPFLHKSQRHYVSVSPAPLEQDESEENAVVDDSTASDSEDECQ